MGEAKDAGCYSTGDDLIDSKGSNDETNIVSLVKFLEMIQNKGIEKVHKASSKTFFHIVDSPFP